MTVVRESYPDFTAFDPKDPRFNPKIDKENPRWHMVDVRYKRALKRLISLQELKDAPELANMALVRRVNRLSVMPVTNTEWDFILGLE